MTTNIVRIGSKNEFVFLFILKLKKCFIIIYSLSVSEVLDPFLEKTFMEIPQNAHENEVILKQLRTSLIALTIICNKHLKLLNASSMSRIVALASMAISVNNFETRVLALRLIRILCEKMPNYCLSLYKVYYLLFYIILIYHTYILNLLTYI